MAKKTGAKTKRMTAKQKAINEYKALAKKADRNLRNLESKSKQTGYEGILNFAYAKAIKDIEYRFGSGQTRFDKKLSKAMTLASIQSAIADVKKFLAYETSTVGGINTVYRKRLKTINEKLKKTGYPTMTLQEYINLFESGLWDRMSKKYDSGQVWVQFAKIKMDNKSILNKVKKAKSEDPASYINTLEGLAEAQIKSVEQNGISIDDLLEVPEEWR